MRFINLLLYSVTVNYCVLAQVPVLNQKFQHPESVITDGKFIYVADIGKSMEPSAKDGDGKIYKLTLKGKLITDSFATTLLHAPKGMAIINNTLYVADIDRIVGISLVDGKRVTEINLSSFKTQLLNDLASVNDTTIYATATDINKIFKVNLGRVTTVATINISPVVGANGLCYDRTSNRLYIVGLGLFTDTRPTGKIGFINLSKSAVEYTPVPAPTGFYDGVAILNDHSLIVSDWGSLHKTMGAIYKIDLQTGKRTKLNFPGLIAGPADFWLDRRRNMLLIPEIMKGKILNYKL